MCITKMYLILYNQQINLVRYLIRNYSNKEQIKTYCIIFYYYLLFIINMLYNKLISHIIIFIFSSLCILQKRFRGMGMAHLHHIYGGGFFTIVKREKLLEKIPIILYLHV